MTGRVSRRARRLLLRCMGGFKQGGGEGKGYALPGGWEQGLGLGGRRVSAVENA